jgi:guanosine-3',5'-bis(diphosphate) 3'-pyrophosphohydrolase
VIKPKPAGAIHISGSEGIAVQLGHCCQPIPGDPIIGVIRKGRGLEVHRHDCTAVAKVRGDRGRWVDVEWEPGQDRLFDVTIRVLTREGRGVLARVASAVSDADCNIHNVTMDNEQGLYTALNLTIQVRDRMHLANVMRAVRRVPDVVRISRPRSDGRGSD